MASLIGAFLGCFLLTLFLHWLSRGWPRSYGKIFVVNAIVLIIAVLLSAVATAYDGPPNFSHALNYVLGQAVVLAIDLTRLWRTAPAPATDSVP